MLSENKIQLQSKLKSRKLHKIVKYIYIKRYRLIHKHRDEI